MGLSVSLEGPGGEVGKLGVLPQGSLSLKAQVYTTSIGWGPAGVCTEGPGWLGWVSKQTPGPYQPAHPGPGGFLVRSKLPGLAWSQPRLEKPPCGQRFPGAGPGSKTGWRVRSEDGVPAPGEDPWPRENGQQKGLTVSLA